jgi:hypothetical protein
MLPDLSTATAVDRTRGLVMGGPAGPVGIFWVRGFTDVTPRPSNAPPPPPDPPRGVAAKELWRKVPGERTSMGKGKEKEKGGGGGGGVTHVSWGLVCAGVVGDPTRAHRTKQHVCRRACGVREASGQGGSTRGQLTLPPAYVCPKLICIEVPPSALVLMRLTMRRSVNWLPRQRENRNKPW